MNNNYINLSDNKYVIKGLNNLRTYLNDEVYKEKYENAPKSFCTLQLKLEKEVLNDKSKDDLIKLKEKEDVVDLQTSKSKTQDKKKNRKHPKHRYIVFEEKKFDINQNEPHEDDYKNKIKFPNPNTVYLKDPNEKHRKMAMEQILDGVFNDKKKKLKKINKVSSVPNLFKPFSNSDSSTNLIEKNEKKSQILNPNNKNFFVYCDMNKIITLDQKMDYYMLLRQNALDSFPDLRIETGNINTRNSKESGRFKPKNSESIDKSSVQKSERREYSFSSSSKVANDVYHRYLNVLKEKYKKVHDVNFNNNKHLENYLNDLYSKYITFKDGLKSYDNLNHIEKIRLVMKARELVNHRIILKESELTEERFCYLIHKKCIDFKILSHIDVSKNNLGDTGCVYLLYLIDLYSKYLSYLNISYNMIGKQSIELISNILQKNVIPLAGLNLSGNGLGEKLFCEIGLGLSKNISVERFWISNNSLSKPSCIILGTILRYDKKLSFLDVSKNQFNDDSLHDMLKGLIGNTTLEVLVLNECNMTNLSLKILDVVLQLNSSLKELYLERNKFNNISCKSISEIMNKNPLIEIISLIGNKIDHEGIDVLVEGQRKIPIKIIGVKDLYWLKFNPPLLSNHSNNNLIFEFF